MAKPEWGVKRTCHSCGARFYDLMHSPIICPKCSAVVEPEVTFKLRRQPVADSKAAKLVPAVLDKDVLAETDGLDVAEDEDADAAVIEGDEDDESGLIEDASDLGEDDDDMAEVMEHLDEDIESEG